MTYTEYHFITADEASAEILLALLSELEFNTFDLKDNELFAYIPSDLAEKSSIEIEITRLLENISFTYTSKIYDDKNWNEEWEKNFQPVVVANKVHIRAPFHPADEDLPFEIIIEPRMSFGTGHHESTYLMIEQMLEIDFTNKIVFDAGCGTGILAIFAAQHGAAQVFAVDNNEWAYANSKDNAALNNINNSVIRFELGELDIFRDKQCDILLANINKPIIIQSLALFKNCLTPNGLLLISGILIPDIQDILTEAVKHGFHFVRSKTKGDWICAELNFLTVENF